MTETTNCENCRHFSFIRRTWNEQNYRVRFVCKNDGELRDFLGHRESKGTLYTPLSICTHYKHFPPLKKAIEKIREERDGR